MRYHQVRNATCVLEFDSGRVLVDPMLGQPGTLPPYALVRYRARRNPLTPLPDGWEEMLEGVEVCLLSHIHFGTNCDHLDAAGVRWLKEHGVRLMCRSGDEKRLRKKGLAPDPISVSGMPLLSGTITPYPTSHGRGIVGKLMGPGAGYFLAMGNEPSVYLTGDTVLTDTVRDVLAKHQPDVCIVPGGGARLDLGGPVLMDLDELVEFIELAPGRVIINHIGALNHCPIRFDDVRQRLTEGQQGRVHLVADGESVELRA